MICIIISAAILVVYWQVQHYDLIPLDDIDYITGNPYVKAGLTRDSIVWAMQDIHTGYWHPLTWVSHMLDYQFFRSRVGGHHWTNVIFHIANSILLYTVLKRMSGSCMEERACGSALCCSSPECGICCVGFRTEECIMYVLLVHGDVVVCLLCGASDAIQVLSHPYDIFLRLNVQTNDCHIPLHLIAFRLLAHGSPQFVEDASLVSYLKRYRFSFWQPSSVL